MGTWLPNYVRTIRYESLCFDMENRLYCWIVAAQIHDISVFVELFSETFVFPFIYHENSGIWLFDVRINSLIHRVTHSTRKSISAHMVTTIKYLLKPLPTKFAGTYKVVHQKYKGFCVTKHFVSICSNKHFCFFISSNKQVFAFETKSIDFHLCMIKSRYYTAECPQTLYFECNRVSCVRESYTRMINNSEVAVFSCNRNCHYKYCRLEK